MMYPQESRVGVPPRGDILGTFYNLCPTGFRLAVLILALMPTSLLKEGKIWASLPHKKDEINSRGIPVLENQGYTNDRLYIPFTNYTS
jgi:hypothetical protein